MFTRSKRPSEQWNPYPNGGKARPDGSVLNRMHCAIERTREACPNVEKAHSDEPFIKHVPVAILKVKVPKKTLGKTL